MTLWLRGIHLILASSATPKLDPAQDPSVIAFRVWPHDLDRWFARGMTP